MVFYSGVRGWNRPIRLSLPKADPVTAANMKNTHTYSLWYTHAWTNTWLQRLYILHRSSTRPQAPPSHKAPQLHTTWISDHSKKPVHSFWLLGWESWLMTWQRSSMQIANICHSASSTPYIYLLILLNISAYYWLFVGGGQWCMFLHDGVQKKAISCNPHIHSCCFF